MRGLLLTGKLETDVSEVEEEECKLIILVIDVKDNFK